MDRQAELQRLHARQEEISWALEEIWRRKVRLDQEFRQNQERIKELTDDLER